MGGNIVDDMPPAYLEGVEFWNNFNKEWEGE